MTRNEGATDERRLLAHGLITVLLAAALASSGQPWIEKPWTDWTAKEVEKILEDSPWMDAPMASIKDEKRGPRGVRWLVNWYVIVRWESSLTVRQAKARKAQLEGRMGDAESRQYIASDPEAYIIAVLGPGAISLANLHPEVLRSSSYMQLQQTKQKIETQSVRTLVQASGEPIVEFHFARELSGKPVLGPAEKKISFVIKTRVLETEAEFDLRKMVRDGRPDL